jgi:hypothetical protein
LAGDLNAKHPSSNSAVSNPSGQKLLLLFDTSDSEISAPQCPTHYSPVGNGDVLDIVAHKNIRISNVMVLETNSGVKADKTARAFTASIVSTYRLSTSKLTL